MSGGFLAYSMTETKAKAPVESQDDKREPSGNTPDSERPQLKHGKWYFDTFS